MDIFSSDNQLAISMLIDWMLKQLSGTEVKDLDQLADMFAENCFRLVNKTEELRVKKLLEDRYEVMMDWPGNVIIKVGKVYSLPEIDGILTGLGWDNASKHPGIFRKLGWWEKRRKEEMPKFIKYILNGEVLHVYEVAEWKMGSTIWFRLPATNPGDFTTELGVDAISPVYFPATREEYLKYSNK